MSKALFYTLSKFQQFQLNFFQQNSVTTKPVVTVTAKQVTNYPFVTLIRCISMMGIVWAHVVVFTGYKDERDFFNTEGNIQLYIPFMQVFKFGVINFFIISGFLLSDKIKTESLIKYYTRRLQTTVKPFLVVLLIFITFIAFRVFVIKHDTAEEHSTFLKIIDYCLFDTPLWYLPNYLISLGIILIFSKFSSSKFFGGILFTVTLSYTVFTVYTVKYQIPHTSALFAFIFYLWIGIYLRQNDSIIEKIRKIKLVPLVIILIAIFSLSCFESYKLYQNRLGHFNILRISNQVYSVLMFVFLIRVCNAKPNFGVLNPRKETFGIYLYHGIFAWFILPRAVYYINKSKIIDLTLRNTYTFMFYHLVFFILIYSITTVLVKVLLKYNLGYLQSKTSS